MADNTVQTADETTAVAGSRQDDGETKPDSPEKSTTELRKAKQSSEGDVAQGCAAHSSNACFPNDAKIVKEAKRLAKKVDMEEKSFKAIVSLLYKRLHLNRDDKPRLMMKKKLIVSAMKEASTSAVKKTTKSSDSKTSQMQLPSVDEEKEGKQQELSEPDYLDANFVPKTSEEHMEMVVARARKEAEEEEELHRKLVEVARLNAQADMELKKAETLAKLRKRKQVREEKEQMKEMIRRNSKDEDDKNFFADVKNMNAQLMERSDEYNASMKEQERKGMIVLRR
ncbi:MAG: hypothetical protein SGBAC_010754 [Bacillariaceae sp.]